MIVYNKEVTAVACEPGVARKVMAYQKELMMCEISFEQGAKGNVHSHEHLQITYVAQGRFAFTIDGEEKEVGKGDSVFIPANAVHGVICLEEGKLVDVFNPMREDFV